jgi:hypothetical protein
MLMKAKSPYVYVRRGRPRSRRQVEELILHGSRREVYEGVDERDRLDILFDGSRDERRLEVMARLAVKLPDRAFLDAQDGGKRWKEAGGYENPAHDELLDGEE